MKFYDEDVFLYIIYSNRINLKNLVGFVWLKWDMNCIWSC